MNSNALYDKLSQKPEYEKYLYRYGFLITDNIHKFQDQFSYMKSWNLSEIRGFHCWTHPDQNIYIHKTPDADYFLIGHCYNPFRMISDEAKILAQMAHALETGKTAYCEVLAELTGIYVTGYATDSDITVYGDAAGMLMAYYGIVGENIYISSHADLIGNINSLNISDYVRRLTNYKFYPLFGRALPGDISPYSELKRLIPNHSVHIGNHTCTVSRFYPNSSWDELTDAYTLDQRIQTVTQILKNSMALIPQKWENPAISLTGGCDSKTTLSCAVDQTDHYRYFSYVSQESEQIDADGAHFICDQLKLPHHIYYIPTEYSAFQDIELVRDIIAVNQGNIGQLGLREVQKRAFLSGIHDFDVEVKSWVSEVARAYYHKRFLKKSFPEKPTPKYLTTLYKVFAHNRKLVKETDEIFSRYIDAYLAEDGLHGWSWIDLFFWEFRVGSWNGLVITGEHSYSGEITIPYNNRKLLELMLAVPLEMRLEDKLYELVRNAANPAVDAAGVAITNLKHTRNRAKLERVYLELHSRL